MPGDAETRVDIYELFLAILSAPSYHILLEALLILCLFWLLFVKSYKLKDKHDRLTDKEKEELISEWEPEPLLPEVPDNHPLLTTIPTISGKIGKLVKVDGRECINAASLNFLGMLGNQRVEEKAVQSLRKYGVGACGPRGFYGTMDVHLELEDKLARFMNCEESIIYSYGFSTIASAIPAYAKKGDIIFCDEAVSFAIQKGIQQSRSKLKIFKHNDVQHLERLLKEQANEDRKKPKKAAVTRKFLVCEGLYMNRGDICPLPDFVRLKFEYKVRIILDESLSFGVLGKTGHGVTEHFQISMDDMDIVCGTLEYSIGSIGGYSVGRSFVVDHQRMSGLAYAFSASLPPMLASAAIETLNLMIDNPGMFGELKDKCHVMNEELIRVASDAGLKVDSLPVSPIQHVRLAEPSGDWHRDQKTLEDIVEHAFQSGVALTVARYLEKEEWCVPQPSIRVAVNLQLSNDEIRTIAEALSNSAVTIVSNKPQQHGYDGTARTREMTPDRTTITT